MWRSLVCRRLHLRLSATLLHLLSSEEELLFDSWCALHADAALAQLSHLQHLGIILVRATRCNASPPRCEGGLRLRGAEEPHILLAAAKEERDGRPYGWRVLWVCATQSFFAFWAKSVPRRAPPTSLLFSTQASARGASDLFLVLEPVLREQQPASAAENVAAAILGVDPDTKEQ